MGKPMQQILIPDIPEGNALDIGDGGEGVMARAGGTRSHIKRLICVESH
jgi:hypothetical protein